MSEINANAAVGRLYVISAPSGAGKTSLVKALLEQTKGIEVSVSHTTRAMRPGEQDGKDYHFIDKSRFEEMVAADDFLEHAQVFDNYYCTALSTIQQRLDAGIDVILEIDWQGARQVRKQVDSVLSIFILPPSRQALEQRLQGRGQDSDEIIARRMRDAVSESSHYNEFDYLVINDDFDIALSELGAIISSERLRGGRQWANHAGMIQELLKL